MVVDEALPLAVNVAPDPKHTVAVVAGLIVIAGGEIIAKLVVAVTEQVPLVAVSV
jgi:hypothetical protein